MRRPALFVASMFFMILPSLAHISSAGLDGVHGVIAEASPLRALQDPVLNEWLAGLAKDDVPLPVCIGDAL